jgi:hypothetical protein
MAAPAMTARTAAPAGATPANLNAAAPDEKVEGLAEDAVEDVEELRGVTDGLVVVAVEGVVVRLSVGVELVAVVEGVVRLEVPELVLVDVMSNVPVWE